MTGKNKEWEQQAELICTPKVKHFWGAYQYILAYFNETCQVSIRVQKETTISYEIVVSFCTSVTVLLSPLFLPVFMRF